MRISRPCYDKPHRCPGWAGGGTRRAKTYRCENGSLARAIYYRRDTIDPPRGDGSFIHIGYWAWRFNRCPTCRVVVLPYVVRWLDPAYWIRWRIPEWWSYRQYKRSQRFAQVEDG